MATTGTPGLSGRHVFTYPRFLWHLVVQATEGSLLFVAVMVALTAVALVGVNAWAHQVTSGMVLTGMTDHVSWGLYIANFTFAVGLAAGGVMMVIPAYVYDDHDIHDVVIVGEILAIAAIFMSLLFVTVDLGRPDRFWHMMPWIGRFNWPLSMLTWDVVALGGYLLINLHITGYLLYMRFVQRKPDPRWYVPFVFVSIVWAVSIHTVTAFLYAGLGGRPFWNSALLAPRFLASAFVTGPAFIILTLQALRRFGGVIVGQGPVRTLTAILRVTVVINLFMLLSEAFTEFYSGGTHTRAAQYLYFGLDGANGLVPWIWTAIAVNVAACVALLHPASSRSLKVLNAACVAVLIGVWIEKGMGLVIPGFVPSALQEIVEYSPSVVEWKVTAGIWAFGLMVFIVGLKLALPVLRPAPSPQDDQEVAP
jgi:Ni/Fe-hydrogenase subunit HybB-like protein